MTKPAKRALVITIVVIGILVVTYAIMRKKAKERGSASNKFLAKIYGVDFQPIASEYGKSTAFKRVIRGTYCPPDAHYNDGKCYRGGKEIKMEQN